MLNLFPELSGGLAGGVGAAAGGLLGQIGDVLSAPRRALWSALGGPESGAELMHKTFGMDPEGFGAKALGMGAEILGDPLTWAGGPLTRALGGAVGKSATKAQLLKGPEYAADAGKLAALAEDAGSPLAKLLAKENPGNVSRLAAEIPEGSSLLGAGAEGTALRTPQGGVIRLEYGSGGAPMSRVNAPEVLQPFRNVTMGNTRLEHLPMITTDASALGPMEAEYNTLRAKGSMTPAEQARRSHLANDMVNESLAWKDRQAPLLESARSRGLMDADLHTGNVGMTADGRLLTHDPGTFLWDSTGPTAASTALGGEQPGRIGSVLSRLLGGRGRLRDQLAQGYASGGVGQGILPR